MAKKKPSSSNTKVLTKVNGSYEFPSNFSQLAIKNLAYAPSIECPIPGQVILISKFLSPQICQELIVSFESGLNIVTTPLIKSKDYAARVNDRALKTDYEASETLWKYLQKYIFYQSEYESEDESETRFIKEEFKNAIGLNPQLRIYRYLKGHYFGKHYDDSVTAFVDSKEKVKGLSHWTLLIYLTGDTEFEGGGTVFHYNDPESRNLVALNVHPSKGMALLHKHGDDCLLHEAELVNSGVKWVLRSDVVFPLS
ncbi:BA75_03922T0 [Komagataella pastoris]|uniref:BA75_03922T0 n=1 Tax=Komagataella pastoris TaxID=4922 RepID=A0A1B2JE19_PICPA|nr:BA75_03922T0 [Komagataella pastoris]